MANIVINQAQFYNSDECAAAIQEIESRYCYSDEIEHFSRLVNFSTAKAEPFQRWVRYREGYSTVLVNELIDKSDLDPDCHFIADPMVGSGSTLIAAKKRGFDALGVDVNPYCKVIIDAKMMELSDTDIACIESFLQYLPAKFDGYDGILPPLSDYFPDDNLINLLNLKSAILTVNNLKAQQILLSCWFFILENCSNRKKDGNGLATRPAPILDAISHYKAVVQEVISDFTEHPFATSTASCVYTGSACSFASFSAAFSEQTNKQLGAVIFSPPYANAFDYFESYKMELLFGQLYSMNDYQMHKKEQIRNYRISYGRELHCEYPVVELICNEINTAIPKKEAISGKRDARTRLMPNMLRGYFTDMGDVLGQLFKALDTEGSCFIVVDQSAYVGVIVPTDVILARIAEQKGFSVDKIIVCRAAATSGQQRKTYPYLGTTLRESIVCLRKEH